MPVSGQMLTPGQEVAALTTRQKAPGRSASTGVALNKQVDDGAQQPTEQAARHRHDDHLLGRRGRGRRRTVVGQGESDHQTDHGPGHQKRHHPGAAVDATALRGGHASRMPCAPVRQSSAERKATRPTATLRNGHRRGRYENAPGVSRSASHVPRTCQMSIWVDVTGGRQLTLTP